MADTISVKNIQQGDVFVYRGSHYTATGDAKKSASGFIVVPVAATELQSPFEVFSLTEKVYRVYSPSYPNIRRGA